MQSYAPEYVVVLAGDHVYKQDYEIMLQEHVDSGADVTVGCVEVPVAEASAFGVMHIDENQRIIDFVEKPADPPSMPGNPDLALASMGIYVFKATDLYEYLRANAADENSNHDFGKDIIPTLVKKGTAVAHKLSDSGVRVAPDREAYWRDVGTVDAFWQANIDLTDFDPDLDLYARDWPIWTHAENVPPAKFIHAEEDRRGLGHELDGVRRLHRLGQPCRPEPALHECALPFLQPAQPRRGAAIGRDRSARAAARRRDRPRRRDPRGAGRRR